MKRWSAWRCAAFFASFLVAASAHADGGELTLEGAYLPAWSHLAATDLPYLNGSAVNRFEHNVAAGTSYGLSNRLRIHLGLIFTLPAQVVTRDITEAGAGGLTLTQLRHNAQRFQLRLPAGLSFSTDRRAVFDVALTVLAGPEWTRNGAGALYAERQKQLFKVKYTSPNWKVKMSYGVQLSGQWRIRNAAILTVGPQFFLNNHGSYSVAGDARLIVPFAVGPSF